MVNTINKKIIIGFIKENRKGYNKIDDILYPVTCNDTVYRPNISINDPIVIHEMSRGFNMTP